MIQFIRPHFHPICKNVSIPTDQVIKCRDTNTVVLVLKVQAKTKMELVRLRCGTGTINNSKACNLKPISILLNHFSSMSISDIMYISQHNRLFQVTGPEKQKLLSSLNMVLFLGISRYNLHNISRSTV